MLVIPKKDFPKDLNPLGLKRGDVIEVEIGEVTPDFITIDPSTLKLNVMRDPSEPREPLVKEHKKKDTAANMPMPDLKQMIQKPPMAPPPAAVSPTPPMSPMLPK